MCTHSFPPLQQISSDAACAYLHTFPRISFFVFVCYFGDGGLSESQVHRSRVSSQLLSAASTRNIGMHPSSCVARRQTVRVGGFYSRGTLFPLFLLDLSSSFYDDGDTEREEGRKQQGLDNDNYEVTTDDGLPTDAIGWWMVENRKTVSHIQSECLVGSDSVRSGFVVYHSFRKAVEFHKCVPGVVLWRKYCY